MNLSKSTITATLLLAFICLAPCGVQAQKFTAKLFKNIEIGVNGGSTGLELDVAAPISKWGRIRLGIQHMPNMSVPVTFGMSTDAGAGSPTADFDSISKLLKNLTGFEIDDKVTMVCNPTFTNFKLMADLYPFANREDWMSRLRLTAGFYLGGRQIGKTMNSIDEMPMLVMIGIYNNLYDKITADDFVDWAIDNPLIGGDNPVWLAPDEAQALHDKFLNYGKLGVPCGKLPDGSEYLLTPSSKATVRATALVNRFKPYVGIGYDHPLTIDGKISTGFDLGAMFFGRPQIMTHDGIDLNSLSDLAAPIKRSFDTINAIPAYPVVNIRFAYKF